MIIDTIENAKRYPGLGERIARAFALLSRGDFHAAEKGRHEVDRDALFYIVQEYTTKPRAEGVWESHRKYIDVQFVTEGVENMGWAPISSLDVTQAYDASKDAALYRGEGDFFTVPAGTFVALWPEDGHMPAIAHGAPGAVKKIVVKVLL